MFKLEYLRLVAESSIPKSVAVSSASGVAGIILSGGRDPIMISLIASIFGAVTAGFNSLNGIVDIEADRVSRPERPLPSGRLRVDQVRRFTAYFFLLSALLSGLLFTLGGGLLTLLLLAVDHALAIFYSLPPTLKQFGLLANAIVGAHHTLIPMLAGWSISEPLWRAPLQLIMVLFFLSIGIHMMEDFEDLEGDRKMGYRTTPLLLGWRGAAAALTGVFLLSLLTSSLDLVLNGRIYHLPGLPQQLLLMMAGWRLGGSSEASEVKDIHKVCDLLGITTGLTLVAGFLITR